MNKRRAEDKNPRATLQCTGSITVGIPEILPTFLPPDTHASLSFSCADKLLCLYATQIFKEKELAIAYPCLGCRGGLTLFIAYLTLSVHTDTPGRPLDPVLVYPGTTEIRESYMADS